LAELGSPIDLVNTRGSNQVAKKAFETWMHELTESRPWTKTVKKAFIGSRLEGQHPILLLEHLRKTFHAIPHIVTRIPD
jgi:hypothetical protein